MSCTADRALNPEAFRSLIHMHGQKIRYWRASPCPCNNPQGGDYSRACPYGCQYGFLYEEVTLGPAVRAYIYSSKSSILHPDLGWIKVATTMIETMADEIYLSRGDKILSVDAQYVARETRRRGSSDSDELSQLFAFAIDALIVQSASYVPGTDYQLQTDNATGVSTINWIGNSPSEGTVYSVLYKYRPMFWCVGDPMTPPRPSQFNGVPLVQKSELSLKHPSEAG